MWTMFRHVKLTDSGGDARASCLPGPASALSPPPGNSDGRPTREELFEVLETCLVPGGAPTFRRGLSALLDPDDK